ncbi:hypothetical protein niasHT_030163 [Heterodera trifolii]|uniref:Uncharacterized protein n=1 Tax=Heterodera trifolii TaxID=157864 RepID=A0ABD2K2W9_9BILA
MEHIAKSQRPSLPVELLARPATGRPSRLDENKSGPRGSRGQKQQQQKRGVLPPFIGQPMALPSAAGSSRGHTTDRRYKKGKNEMKCLWVVPFEEDGVHTHFEKAKN